MGNTKLRNIIMKVLICLSAVLAIAHCGPLNALLTSGAAAGPVHPATGPIVATKRGWRNIALEGYSEDDNQDGFVDPIGQVAPVAYAAPALTYAAPAVHAAPAVTYAHAPAITYAHHAPVTYTHTVHAGTISHTYAGPHFVAGLPVVAAAAAPAEEA